MNVYGGGTEAVNKRDEGLGLVLASLIFIGRRFYNCVKGR